MHGLRTFKLESEDLDAAKSFYTRALGKPPYFDEPFYVGFDVDGFEIGITPAESPPGSGPSRCSNGALR